MCNSTVVVFVIIIVLLIGDSEGRNRWSESNKYHNHRQGESEFYVEFQGNNGRQLCKEYENCTYPYNFGDTVELTCNRRSKGLLKWIDDYGFYSHRKGYSFTLRFTPDDKDVNLNLTCTTVIKYYEKNITVQLVVQDKSQIRSTVGHVISLAMGKSWQSDQCYGIVDYPTKFQPKLRAPDFINVDKSNTYRWTNFDEHQVISRFDDTQQGTVFYCIIYKEDEDNSDSKESRHLVERTKRTYLFHQNIESNTNSININLKGNGLEHTTDSMTNIIPHQQIELGIPPEEKISGSQNNTTVIVGGVLGTCIIVLLIVLGGFWYKYIRRRTPDDNATEVIYAEIEERSSAPNPPPQNFVPYSTVIGTLVPKH